MSASHPTPPAAPTSQAAGGAADPSMEDILASIRRILSDDETEAAPSATAPAHVPEPEDDVLALDASMLVEEAPPAIPPRPPADPAPAAIVPAPLMPAPLMPAPLMPAPLMPAAAVPAPAPAAPVAALAALPEARTLVAPAVEAAAASSVGTLLRTLIAEREQVVVHRGGPTIEDLVREEIRPLLSLWLDANLPPMVERLVRVEIERVVGRAVS